MSTPRLPGKALRRHRLLSRLQQSRSSSCLVLIGPAGSGKTTLALQWRAELVPLGFAAAWVTIPGRCELESFIEILIAALDVVDQGIAREASALFNRDVQLDSTDEIAIPLIRGLERYPGQLLLLLDDYHNIIDPEVDQLVQTLIDYIPPTSHVFVTSRSTPHLALKRARDNRAATVLTFQDLRFNFSETEAFLRDLVPDILLRDVRVIYELTDGWAAGLRLFCLTTAARNDLKLRRRSIQNPAQFADYFYQEVLHHLSEQELDMISRLAAAPHFNEAMSVALFGPEVGPALVARLLRESMFILAEESGRTSWYRFHPLFRDALKQRFDQLQAVQKIAVHTHLGSWFFRAGHLLEAVRHGVEAGMPELAAEWIGRSALPMFLAGRLRPLARAVALLPDEVVGKEVQSLGLWVAWAQLCHRQFNHCEVTLAAMKASQHGPRGPDGAHQIALLESALAVQYDDTAMARRFLADLELAAGCGDAVLEGGRRNLKGWLYLAK